MKHGIIVDVVALVAFTVLGALHVVPSEVLVGALTMIVAGRYRPPGPPGGGDAIKVGSVAMFAVAIASAFRSVFTLHRHAPSNG